MRVVFQLAVALALSLSAGCEFPRDPEQSLDEIRRGVLRVGVVDNPPWAVHGAAEPGGVEPALLRELAAQLGARIQWVQGPEQELLRALEKGVLHVVVGGFADDNPWTARLGKTRPYYTTRFIVAARRQAPPLTELARVPMAAAVGSAAAGHLRERGARPAPPDWQYRALPSWRLPDSGLQPTGLTLYEDRQVMLVTKGENGWLVTLERFLDAQRPRIEALLREQARASP